MSQPILKKDIRESSRITTQCPDISIGNAKGEEANQIGSLYTRDRIGSASRLSIYARSAKESAYCQGKSTVLSRKKRKEGPSEEESSNVKLYA